MKFIGKRIYELILEEGISARSYTLRIEVNYNSFMKVLKGRQFPSYQLITKIKKDNPKVNLNWLITGEGEKYMV